MTEAIKTYTIRHAFLLPLGLLLFLTGALIAVSGIQGLSTPRLFMLGVILIPVAILFIESLCRRASIGPESICVRKPLRKKEIEYKDILSVDTMQVKKRVFVSLSSEESFIILSNAYARFPDMINTLLERLPATTVSDETREMAKNPPVKSGDIISCWLAVILVSLILYLQVMH